MGKACRKKTTWKGLPGDLGCVRKDVYGEGRAARRALEASFAECYFPGAARVVCVCLCRMAERDADAALVMCVCVCVCRMAKRDAGAALVVWCIAWRIETRAPPLSCVCVCVGRMAALGAGAALVYLHNMAGRCCPSRVSTIKETQVPARHCHKCPLMTLSAAFVPRLPASAPPP